MKKPIQPNLDSVTTIRDDGSRRFVHPADVHGVITTWRAVVGWLLIGVYVALPLVPINGNPAVFLDVQGRQIHLFGLTFVPQDFWLAFFLITGLGFTLFYVTALFGRVWCGWTCPQTVFIEQVFRRVERFFEGDATARRALDAAAWTGEKLVKRGLKWAVFAVLTLAIAHLFISYFISLPSLYRMMHESPLENWGVFVFVALLSGALFFDFVWFREQFCIVLCPYGRLQSVLIDNDSVVIGYDAQRGEPRGKQGTSGVGDCIACNRCVQVCPTGIDIRQGVQIECISCANCIDACDAVMRKIGKPEGLVRYDSTHGLAGKKTRFLRPRTVLYTVLLALGAVVLAGALSTLRPAAVTLLRLPGAPYYMSDGKVRNQFMLRIQNKRNREARYRLRLLNQIPGITAPGTEDGLTVPALGTQERPIVVVVPQTSYKGPFEAEVELSGDGFSITKSATFIGPDM